MKGSSKEKREASTPQQQGRDRDILKKALKFYVDSAKVGELFQLKRKGERGGNEKKRSAWSRVI